MKQPATALLPALLLLVTSALAQPTFSLGVRGGINRAVTTVDPASNQTGSSSYSATTDKQRLTAWQAGAVAHISFGRIAFQPALLFSQKGEHLHYTSSVGGVVGNSTSTFDGTNRYNWLELPLNVVYTLHGDHGLQLFAGPYVALAVGGRQKGTLYQTSPFARFQPLDLDERIIYGPGTGNRRFDAGLSFGLGYRQGPVQVQLSYSLGLINLHSTGADYPPSATYSRPYDAYNRVAQLTGTYFFKL